MMTWPQGIWDISRTKALLSGYMESPLKGACIQQTSLFMQSLFIEHLLSTQQVLGI